jgi:hypothetical protein
MRYARYQAVAHTRSCAWSGDFCPGPGFIDEHKMRGVKLELRRTPLDALSSHIGSLLLAAIWTFLMVGSPEDA